MKCQHIYLLLAECITWINGQITESSTAIDFSDGTIDQDGVVCVEREEERDKIEQDEEQQCTQQNVTQCYNSYTTQYTDVVRYVCHLIIQGVQCPI